MSTNYANANQPSLGTNDPNTLIQEQDSGTAYPPAVNDPSATTSITDGYVGNTGTTEPTVGQPITASSGAELDSSPASTPSPGTQPKKESSLKRFINNFKKLLNRSK